MFEFEDLAHFCHTVFRREGSGPSGLRFVWSGHPRARHPAPRLAGGTPAPILPGPRQQEGTGPPPRRDHPATHLSALHPRTSGAAAEAQGRRAFLLFFLFPFYVVCGHVMEGGFWRVLFSCQPELLIQPGFFLSVSLPRPPSPTPMDFILGNGKVTSWQCRPSHQPPIASLTKAQPRSGPRQQKAAGPGKHPGVNLLLVLPASAWPAGRRPGVPVYRRVCGSPAPPPGYNL